MSRDIYSKYFSENVGKDAYLNLAYPVVRRLKLGKITAVARMSWLGKVEEAEEELEADDFRLADDYYYIIENHESIPIIHKCVKVDVG